MAKQEVLDGTCFWTSLPMVLLGHGTERALGVATHLRDGLLCHVLLVA